MYVCMHICIYIYRDSYIHMYIHGSVYVSLSHCDCSIIYLKYTSKCIGINTDSYPEKIEMRVDVNSVCHAAVLPRCCAYLAWYVKDNKHHKVWPYIPYPSHFQYGVWTTNCLKGHVVLKVYRRCASVRIAWLN